MKWLTILPTSADSTQQKGILVKFNGVVRRLGIIGVMLGALIVFVPSSASADTDWHCKGEAVKRCVAVTWDASARTYRARALIRDAAGGGDFNVRVQNVKLLVYRGDWETVRTGADLDGYHAVEDLARTDTVRPCNWTYRTFSAKATFSWTGASSGSETWQPPFSIRMC